MITKRQDLKETTTGSDKHAAAKGGGEGISTEPCQTTSRQRQVKGWERRGNSKQCVCIYVVLILLTFHVQYCFAAAVTDRDKVRGGKDLNAPQAAGQTIALSLHQHTTTYMSHT